MEGCVRVCRYSYWWIAVALLDIILFWYRFIIFNINSRYAIVCIWLIWILFSTMFYMYSIWIYCGTVRNYQYVLILLCIVDVSRRDVLFICKLGWNTIGITVTIVLKWIWNIDLRYVLIYFFSSRWWSIFIFHHVIFILPYLFIKNLRIFIHWFVYSGFSFGGYCLFELKFRLWLQSFMSKGWGRCKFRKI